MTHYAHLSWLTGLTALATTACGEGRNWEPIHMELTIDGEYGDGTPIDISGAWKPNGAKLDRVEGVGRQCPTCDMGTARFAPGQSTGEHEWIFLLTEMRDPFFLWDDPFATLRISQDLGNLMTVSNLQMRVDELRISGRPWADASFSADIEQAGKGSAHIEGSMELSYQCSNKFWAFGGFCDDFGHDGLACTLLNPPPDCPLELAEVFYAEGADSAYEGGELSFGADPLTQCDTNMPHNEKSVSADTGHVDPGACVSDTQTVSADGCDWTVQAAAYNRYGLNISARADDSCTREAKTCAYKVSCTMIQNWDGP